MRRLPTGLAWLLCCAWLAACGTAPPAPPPPSADGPLVHEVEVVSNGWHTTIVVPREELAATGLLPEAARYPDAAFLEFGWGDRDYFPAEEKTLGMTLSAALAPTPAVMHVAGLQGTPAAGADVEALRVPLTEAGFRGLVEAIAADFERPADGPAEPVSEGLRPGSHFYHARGEFHLFNTCNTWTVRMLRAGGVDVSPSGAVTAEDAMERLREARGGPGAAARQVEPAAAPGRWSTITLAARAARARAGGRS